jgi:predicted NUDIX family NTP pyrophosphohydrolase
VLLVHPGGPFWAKKDSGVWSFPKGELKGDESALAAARREFREETSQKVPAGDLIPLGETKLSGGKVIHAWALQADLDVTKVKCNTFKMEWPPNSGVIREFPENDQAAWFDLSEAKRKLFSSQSVFIDRLAEYLQMPEVNPAGSDPPQLSLL